jgi:hypothetical protein
MNIDLPPFAAFALQSSGSLDHPSAESHTLTLRLTRSAVRPAYAPSMSGRARIQAIPVCSDGAWRAAILPDDAPGLTITF